MATSPLRLTISLFRDSTEVLPLWEIIIMTLSEGPA